MKTKEVKRVDATIRNQNTSFMTPEERLGKLNSGKYRALKERKRLAIILGLDSIRETAGYDFGGSVEHFDLCVN